MILDMIAEARRQELQVRETEITQRMNWYDARSVDRLERALARAKARLRIGTQSLADGRTTPAPKDALRPGGGTIVGGTR